MSYKIINIGGMVVNNYIIITEDGCIAIDTGYAGGFDKFARKLLKNGLRMSDIKYIFLTHAHDDHAGFLGELLDATSATLILHRDAVERLKKGQNSFEGGCTSQKALSFCKVLALFGKGKHLFPPIDVSGKAITVAQDDQTFMKLGIEAKVLLLPGHTVDSIGLLLKDGVLFCGDAAMNGPTMTARHPIWLENLEEHRKTWDTIITSGAKTIYSGHGKPFPAADLKRFRHYLDDKKLYPLKEY
jgi:glyoxylase-like metal-dependent hydrolase (beta-lactamase superfamily II)